jgi:hypothetical protein
MIIFDDDDCAIRDEFLEYSIMVRAFCCSSQDFMFNIVGMLTFNMKKKRHSILYQWSNVAMHLTNDDVAEDEELLQSVVCDLTRFFVTSWCRY